MNRMHTSAKPYFVGFLLSLVLTLISFSLVHRGLFNGWALLAILSILAVVQLMIQLIYFLHLREEKAPHWQNITFLFAAVVVIILVFGTLWIMKNLNYHGNGHLNPSEIYNEIQKEENIYQ